MALAILHGHDQENLLLLFQFFFGSLHPVAGEGTNNTCRLGLQMGYFGRIRENLSECLVELPSMPCPFALRRFERISRGATEREQQGEEQDESIHVVFFCLTSKMSRGGKWREPCVSRDRDIYRSWLHRLVRLSFHSV
jgi:hypothetical protein